MAGEALVFYSGVDESAAWRDAIRGELPDLEFRTWPEAGDPADVRYALVWKPPEGFFQAFPNLSLIINLGAGVDAILARSDLPPVPISRISDPHMARMMASYVVFAVLRYYRDIPAFERAQRRREWHYIHPREPGELTVGVMGLGELGRRAAEELGRWGFTMRGWARSRHRIDGVETFAGREELNDFLDGLDIVVILLPLTPQTRGLIDRSLLEALPRGAKLINAARGEVIDEAALLEALRSGHIAEATLDAFATEPLPPEHPLWDLDRVLITPHLASIAIPRTAARQIADNIRRVRNGREPVNLVDPARGY